MDRVLDNNSFTTPQLKNWLIEDTEQFTFLLQPSSGGCNLCNNWQIIAFFPCGLMCSKRSTVWSLFLLWEYEYYMVTQRFLGMQMNFRIFPCLFFLPYSYFVLSCLFFYLDLAQDVSLSAYGLHLITKEWCWDAEFPDSKSSSSITSSNKSEFLLHYKSN